MLVQGPVKGEPDTVDLAAPASILDRADQFTVVLVEWS